MRVCSDAARFSAPEYRALFDSPDGLILDDLRSNEAIEQRAAELHHAAAKANKGEGQNTTSRYDTSTYGLYTGCDEADAAPLDTALSCFYADPPSNVTVRQCGS